MMMQKKTLFLESKGFHVLRFRNSRIICELESCLEKIYRVLEEIKEDPSPQSNLFKRGGKVIGLGELA